MKLDIPRLSAKNENFRTQVEGLIQKETPFILSDMDIHPKLKDSEYLKELFKKDSSKHIGWYNSVLLPEFTPSWISELLESPQFTTRKDMMRAFAQPKGHLTFAHYDGNSIHGLNLQVLGRKEWFLISPETPLELMPFMYVAIGKELVDLPREYQYYQFITEPGDLIFVPRYWIHQVKSLEEINANINWVFTPKTPGTSKLALREREILFLRSHLPLINKAYFPEPLDQYGGKGKEVIDTYVGDLGITRPCLRLIRELAKYPKLLVYIKYLKSKANDFKENNFNI